MSSCYIYPDSVGKLLGFLLLNPQSERKQHLALAFKKQVGLNIPIFYNQYFSKHPEPLFIVEMQDFIEDYKQITMELKQRGLNETHGISN